MTAFASPSSAPLSSRRLAQPAPPAPSAPPPPGPLNPRTAGEHVERFQAVRDRTAWICEPLEIEDYVIQTMPDVSPAKWHLGHTTWFFERFILQELRPGYRPVAPAFYYLFNSYYNAAGPQHCRPSRGLLSRPTVAEVYEYRRVVEDRIARLLTSSPDELAPGRPLRERLILGLNHEQQHQELMVTDLKHVFSSNPLLPSYRPSQTREPDSVDTNHEPAEDASPPPARWLASAGGLVEVGIASDAPDFHYDSETPRHRTFLQPFALASRPVTNGEYLAFIQDDGYRRPDLWLSAGWATVREQGWEHPIYWFRDTHDPTRPTAGGTGRWMHYTLRGPEPVDMNEPACHLSLFEADAFARWAGARLPTEFEWEHAAADLRVEGNFFDSGRLHPAPLHTPTMSEAASQASGIHSSPQAMFGDVWQWTASQYTPYPGFRPLPGALGEYNGKFMCNQFVLRGGSCATSRDHTRATYRNFFAPDARWQFTGLRLAKDLE